MPICRNILYSIALFFAFLDANAQMAKPSFIFNVSAGVSQTYFSPATNTLANNSISRLGTGFQVSAERFLKGQFGLGIQIEHIRTEVSNYTLASDMNRRLLEVPRLTGLRTSELLLMKQTCYSLQSSIIQQKKQWQFEYKLSVGLGLTSYGITGEGFVPDTAQSITVIHPQGTKHVYSVNCAPYVSLQPQILARYVFHSNQRRSIALFAGLAYSYQKIRFEYLEQQYPNGTAAKQTNNYETVQLWRQNLQYISLRAGISINLNKKVS